MGHLKTINFPLRCPYNGDMNMRDTDLTVSMYSQTDLRVGFCHMFLLINKKSYLRTIIKTPFYLELCHWAPFNNGVKRILALSWCAYEF